MRKTSFVQKVFQKAYSEKIFMKLILFLIPSFLTFFVFIGFYGLSRALEEIFLFLIPSIIFGIILNIWLFVKAASEIYDEQLNTIRKYEHKIANPSITFKIDVICSEKYGYLYNYHAFLKIENNENLPINNCKVYMDSAFHFETQNFKKPVDVSNILKLPRRLRWRKEDFGNDLCEVDIEHKISKKIELAISTNDQFYIPFCDGAQGRYGLNQVDLKLIGEIGDNIFEKKFRAYIYTKLIDEVKEGNTRLLYNVEFRCKDAEQFENSSYQNLAQFLLNKSEKGEEISNSLSDFIDEISKGSNPITVTDSVVQISNYRKNK